MGWDWNEGEGNGGDGVTEETGLTGSLCGGSLAPFGAKRRKILSIGLYLLKFAADHRCVG